MRPSEMISRPVEQEEMKGDDGEVFFSEYTSAKERAAQRKLNRRNRMDDTPLQPQRHLQRTAP